MGRRRRRVVRIVKKKLPTVFVCPRCGEEAVRVTIAKDTGHATVLCALCNLKDEFPAHPAAQAIDVYSYFTDRFYGVKDPRPIIPHDREIIRAPPEEEPEEGVTEPIEEMHSDITSSEEMTEKRDIESPSPIEELSQPEVSPPSPVIESPSEETSQTSQESDLQVEAETPAKSGKESEEAEPFADILENKDKKRYSSTPLPQQTSEQTS